MIKKNFGKVYIISLDFTFTVGAIGYVINDEVGTAERVKAYSRA